MGDKGKALGAKKSIDAPKEVVSDLDWFDDYEVFMYPGPIVTVNNLVDRKNENIICLIPIKNKSPHIKDRINMFNQHLQRY